jgi:hypothetical protein
MIAREGHKKGSTDRPPHADLPSCVFPDSVITASHYSAVSFPVYSLICAGQNGYLLSFFCVFRTRTQSLALCQKRIVERKVCGHGSAPKHESYRTPCSGAGVRKQADNLGTNLWRTGRPGAAQAGMLDAVRP